MSADSSEIQTVSAAGNSHPGFCWGQWEAGAPECGRCKIASTCSDATKRLTNKTSRQQPVVPKHTPKPALKQEVPPAPPPPASKPEPSPVQDPSPAPVSTPEATTPETSLEMLVRVVDARIGGSHVLYDKGVVFTISFTSETNVKFGGLFAKAHEIALLKTTKGEKTLNSGFTEKDVLAALDELL